MKFTLEWLKEYIDCDLTVNDLADRLTMLGLEVDSVQALGEGLEGIKVARILATTPHPNADRLTLCEVEVAGEQLTVVCGAPNARPGLVTAIAVPGTVLPSGMKVKKAKIRGEKSFGMLCSESELEISDGHDGIMELPITAFEDDRPFVQALGLSDTMIEVDLTPNRPDCASVIGIAREVAGLTGCRLKPPVTRDDLPKLTGSGLDFTVTVEAPRECPRYMARLLKNVTVGPSPWWLKNRLAAVGLRSINNVVDVTNLVMLEYGQPLHAFDYQKLAGNRIVVRLAQPGEKIVTLDGTERSLDPEMLMICDQEKPVAVAGVMGGANSEVTGDTVEILLESACFDPVSVRRTARNLNLGTDASYRFERGVDPQGAPLAMERAVRLLVELAGAEVVDDGVDFCEGIAPREAIGLRASRVNSLLGLNLSRAEIAKVLIAIEMAVENQDDDQLLVTPPSFRVDIEREVDLIEEVARLVGFNEIPTTLPLTPMHFVEPEKSRGFRRQVAGIMTALGFYEAINYSFGNPLDADRVGLAADDPLRQAVALLNPLTDEQGIMRTMLLPGILENVRRNINHQNNDLRLFEVGKVFLANGDQQPVESQMLTAVLSGRRAPDSPVIHHGTESVDLYDIKGAVTGLFKELRIEGLTFGTGGASPSYAAAGSCTILQAGDLGEIGGFGQLDQAILKAFGIKQEAYFMNIDLDRLFQVNERPRAFSSLPRYPAVFWDIAVVVPESVKAGEMLAAITEMNESLVERAELFDVYRGKPVAEGAKSVAISVTYRSIKQTLDDETVDRVHQKIITMLLDRFDGRLREAI